MFDSNGIETTFVVASVCKVSVAGNLWIAGHICIPDLLEKCSSLEDNAAAYK